MHRVNLAPTADTARILRAARLGRARAVRAAAWRVRALPLADRLRLAVELCRRRVA